MSQLSFSDAASEDGLIRPSLSNILIKYKLLNLFDRVINLRFDQKISEYISGKDAIFVDSSFSERTDVAQKCGIPTFNASMIELISQG